MTISVRNFLVIAVMLASAVACNAGSKTGASFPSPAVDEPAAANKGQETAVIAGGCFWGIQAVFQHVKGVTNANSGYSGGDRKLPPYELGSPGGRRTSQQLKIHDAP